VSFLKNLRDEFFPRPNKSKAALEEALSTHPNKSKTPVKSVTEDLSPNIENQQDLWHKDTIIIDLTGCGDYLRIGDCCTGIGVFGGTGSGKTSAFAPIGVDILTVGCGAVFLCAKPDDALLYIKMAAAAGRTKDVVIIGEDIKGGFTRHAFNILEYEGSKADINTQSIVSVLTDSEKVLSRKEGEKAPDQGERFWQQQFEMLLEMTVDTARLAGKPLSIQTLREIQLTAPKNKEEVSNEKWVKTSFCSQCLLEANKRFHQNEISLFDLNRIANYWLKDYASLDQKPRSSIDITFAGLVNSFMSNNRIRAVLCGKSTVTPDDVLNGKIVIFNLPTSIYHNAGRMAQFIFKIAFQRAMLARRKPLDGSLLRPCLLWIDECHNFATPFDATYTREVRSNMGITVFLEQGIGGYMQAMGFTSPHQVDDYLQNLSNKCFFHNTSPETHRFAADAIGKLLIDQDSQSHSYSMGNSYNVGDSTTQHERHQIVSGEFAFLKRGGAKNNGIVTGYFLRPEVFNLTGTNFALCQFQQTDLTR